MSTFVLIVGGLLLLALLAAAGLALHVTWKLTHPVRKPVDMDPAEYGLARVDAVRFPSRETRLSLAGWYISAAANGFRSRKQTLVFAHGYSQNRLEPHLPALSLASKLVEAGYDVLMFDFRNAGESDQAMTTIGLKEQDDLRGAIDYVHSVQPDHAVGLVGFSMGAATSLLAGAADERVKAIVADSPFYSLPEYLGENLPKWTGLPRFPFNWLILTLCPLFLGANPRDVKPYLAVQQADKPILLIHGTHDTTVPHENSQRLYELARAPGSSLWLVPGAGHVRSYAKEPEKYVSRVRAFLEDAMGEQTT